MVPNLRAGFLNPPDVATTHYHSEFDAQWQEELGQKAQTEEEKRQEMVIAAKGAMDEWGAQREVQRESKTSQNRQDEQLLCEQCSLELTLGYIDQHSNNPRFNFDGTTIGIGMERSF